MKRSQFKEAQIIAILRGAGDGEPDGGCVCCKHGVSSATFSKWKAKFGGLDVPDAKRLDEDAKLKKLLAETMLDNAITMEAAGPKPEREPWIR